MENNSRFENQCCSCHTGNAPCSFCTDSFICDCCGNREDVADCVEQQLGFVCLTCQENKRIAIVSGMQGRYFVFVGGKPSIIIDNIKYKQPEPSGQYDNRPNYSALGEGVKR